MSDVVSHEHDLLIAAVRLHLDEGLSLRAVESTTGVSRSRLARHTAKEKERRQQERKRWQLRLTRLRKQGAAPDWIGWYDNGEHWWFSRPQKLNDDATIPKDGRETLADCLYVNIDHPALQSGGAIAIVLDLFEPMEHAFRTAPNPTGRRGPNRDARNILVNRLCGLHDDLYCGPDADRDVMRAEFVKAASEIAGAPSWKYEPRNGKAPFASKSKLRRLVKRAIELKEKEAANDK